MFVCLFVCFSIGVTEVSRTGMRSDCREKGKEKEEKREVCHVCARCVRVYVRVCACVRARECARRVRARAWACVYGARAYACVCAARTAVEGFHLKYLQYYFVPSHPVMPAG